jgi:hypothetical protein
MKPALRAVSSGDDLLVGGDDRIDAKVTLGVGILVPAQHVAKPLAGGLGDALEHRAMTIVRALTVLEKQAKVPRGNPARCMRTAAWLVRRIGCMGISCSAETAWWSARGSRPEPATLIVHSGLRRHVHREAGSRHEPNRGAQGCGDRRLE